MIPVAKTWKRRNWTEKGEPACCWETLGSANTPTPAAERMGKWGNFFWKSTYFCVLFKLIYFNSHSSFFDWFLNILGAISPFHFCYSFILSKLFTKICHMIFWVFSKQLLGKYSISLLKSFLTKQCYYRPQTKFAKVMFLHLSVILFTGVCSFCWNFDNFPVNSQKVGVQAPENIELKNWFPTWHSFHFLSLFTYRYFTTLCKSSAPSSSKCSAFLKIDF